MNIHGVMTKYLHKIHVGQNSVTLKGETLWRNELKIAL